MWKELWENYGGRILGALGGFFFGFLYLAIGFWDMLFFALLVFIGYWIGKSKDLKQNGGYRLHEWMEWLNDRWRLFK